MRITSLNIKADKSYGLGPIKMKNLGQVVAITGPNGAGKTRAIRKISKILAGHIKVSDANSVKAELERLKEQREKYRVELDNGREQLERFRDENSKEVAADNYYKNLIHEISGNEAGVKATSESIQRLEERLSNDLIVTDRYADSYLMTAYMPKALNLRDSEELSSSDLRQSANRASQLGIGGLADGALAQIQNVQNRWCDTFNPHADISDVEKAQMIEEYNRLNEYVEAFLGTGVKRNSEGAATLFGRAIGQADLSDGQKILLQICVAIYSQAERLSEVMIVLDEPENHLHPKQIIYVIDKLKECLVDGQIWIATHSINVLAHLDRSSIYYITDGCLEYHGNRPLTVLRGLLGDDDEIGRLRDFLNYPAQLASLKFTAECLIAPHVVNTGPEDEQIQQINQVVKEHGDNQEKIMLLDIGAGKARLLSNLALLNEDVNTADWLEYYAFDISDEHKNECVSALEDCYGKGCKRYFNDETKLIESLREGAFDFVILCNVFHEVDPKSWLDMFSEYRLIRKALKDDGTLLIVEDHELPVGEKAYANGFVVFNKRQFKILFGIEDYRVVDARGGRLRAHYIPCSALNNITAETRSRALEDLKSESYTAIQAIRSNEATYRNGRLHGFWTAQATNSELALRELR